MTGNILLTKGVPRAAMLLTVFVVLIAAAVLVLSLANAALSRERMQRGEGTTLTGEIVAVQNTGSLTILTVVSDNLGRFPNDQLNIFADPDSRVKICKANEPARDVQVDHDATVTYHEVKGLAVADRVAEHC